MFRVRHTLEGRLELVKATESWSHCTLPGRGISPSLAQQRDEEVASWPEGVPPVPEWEQLEAPMLFHDDLPEEPGADDIVIDCELASLELSDHQKLMLQSVESRMASIIAPGSVASRVTRKRAQH